MTSLICPLPWIHFSLENSGHSSLCCISDDNSGFDEKRKTEAHREIRKDFLKGQWPSSCHRCQSEEAAGGHSYRMGQVKNFPHFTHEKAQSFAEEPAPLESIDIRLGNQCNLACVMCRPSDSTTWISELKDNPLPSALKSNIRMDLPPSSPKESIIHKLPGDLEKVTEVTLGGGEPLLIKDHEILISHLIESNIAKNINLNYHTNLTQVSDAIFKCWENFKTVTLFISLDGVEKWAEYVRYPTNWNRLHENIFKVLSKIENCANIQVRFLMTIHALNAPHLPEFIEYLSQLTKQTYDDFAKIFIPNLVMDPPYLNVANIPDRWKDKLTVELSRLIPLYPRLKSLKAALSEAGDLKDKITLKNYIKYLEDARTVKLKEISPQYYNDLVKVKSEVGR